MKALVLCGGIPQIELMKNLKARGIEVILADMNEKVVDNAVACGAHAVDGLCGPRRNPVCG